MKKLLSLALCVIMAIGLFAGCAKDAPADDVKEMVIGAPKVSASFNPYGSGYGTGDDQSSRQIYDSLVTKDKDGKIAPAMAESWDVSDDVMTITFHIKKGIKFTNGAEFTAEDAKFNIDLCKATPTTTWAMENVDVCTVIDSHTLEVRLLTVDMSFFESMAWMQFVSKDFYEQHGDNYGLSPETTCGTGAYILKEITSGDSAVFEVNPNYYRGEANVKKLRYKTISDANAAVIALKTGEINYYVKDVPVIAINDLSGNDKVSVASFPSPVFMDILLNCQTGLFSDIKLREAVALGVDRQKMLTVGTEGHGVIVDHPGGPDYTGNPNVKIFPDMDQAKAAQLVKDAGAEGTEVVIITQDVDPWPKLATALQDDLNKIGFKARVEQIDSAAYGQEVWTNHNYEIAISRYWSGTKEMAELMALVQSGHAMNFSLYENPAADPFIIQAGATADEATRHALYTQAIELVMPEFPLIPLYYSYGSRAFSSDLTIEPGLAEQDVIYNFSWK